MNGPKPWWQKSKFRMSILAAIVAGVANYFGLDPDQIMIWIAPFLAYILGEAYVDGKASSAYLMLLRDKEVRAQEMKEPKAVKAPKKI